MAQIEKTRDTQGWWATNRKSASGSANWYNPYGRQFVLKKLKVELLYDPAIPVLVDAQKNCSQYLEDRPALPCPWQTYLQ